MPTSDPNADYEPKPLDPGFDEKVERLANKLLRGGDGNSSPENIDSARRMARRMLEDSEARTDQASDDPDTEEIIRRTSTESAATGDAPGVRYTSDGE